MRFQKHADNPILSANPSNEWESLCVLNPAVWKEDGRYRMLYRAAGHDETHRIHLGLAESEDGIHFTRMSDQPVLSPQDDGPDGGCIEDPRLVQFEGWYYLTYAARAYPPGQYWSPDWHPMYEAPPAGPHFLLKNNTLTHLAVSRDLRSWKRLGRMTDSRFDNRDVILFPERIGGRFVRLSRPMEWAGEGYGCLIPSIWISFSDDLMEWHDEKILLTGEQWWEDKKIGGSTPPIRTRAGWLHLYHGVDSKQGAYRVGAVLLDLEHPDVVLARTRDFLMEPEHPYETEGYYNGCVFPTGIAQSGDTLFIYYGAADQFCCVATCSLEELLAHMLEK